MHINICMHVYICQWNCKEKALKCVHACPRSTNVKVHCAHGAHCRCHGTRNKCRINLDKKTLSKVLKSKPS